MADVPQWRARGDRTEAVDCASDTTSPAHDEWLLDEALTETFPASDPIRPASRELPPAASRTTAKRKAKRGR